VPRFSAITLTAAAQAGGEAAGPIRQMPVFPGQRGFPIFGTRIAALVKCLLPFRHRRGGCLLPVFLPGLFSAWRVQQIDVVSSSGSEAFSFSLSFRSKDDFSNEHEDEA